MYVCECVINGDEWGVWGWAGMGVRVGNFSNGGILIGEYWVGCSLW